MKKLSYLIISSIIASPFAMAADWEYDSVDTSANTKEELILTNTTYSIDTTDGKLTVTGNLETGSTRLSITGENDLVVDGKLETTYNRTTLDNANLNVTGDINTMYGNGEIFVTGTSSQNGSGKWVFQSGGKLTLDEGATLNAKNTVQMLFNASMNLGANSTFNAGLFQNLYENDTGFSITMGDGAKFNASGSTIKVKNLTLGKNNTINANVEVLNTFEVGQGTTINGNLKADDLIINKGASISGSINYVNSLTINSGASVQLPNYYTIKNTINLINPGAKAITAPSTSLYIDTSSTINIRLGNNSLESVNNQSKALIHTLFFEPIDETTAESARINVSLSDFVLGEDFAEGETYKLALIYAQYRDISSYGSIIKLIDDSDVADFVEDSLSYENHTWWVTVQGVSVPEPSTYAAIFGALALAFAAYRRRKR